MRGLEHEQQLEFRRASALLGVVERVARERQRRIDVERQLHHPHLGYFRLLGKTVGEAVDGDDGAAVVAAEGPDLAVDERAFLARRSRPGRRRGRSRRGARGRGRGPRPRFPWPRTSSRTP